MKIPVAQCQGLRAVVTLLVCLVVFMDLSVSSSSIAVEDVHHVAQKRSAAASDVGADDYYWRPALNGREQVDAAAKRAPSFRLGKRHDDDDDDDVFDDVAKRQPTFRLGKRLGDKRAPSFRLGKRAPSFRLG